MADHDSDHHHRHHRLSAPLHSVAFSARAYPSYSYPITPTSNLSKFRPSKSLQNKTSFSFFYLILLSLRAQFSLLPFLRSSSLSFSLFPFAFLLSLFSFLVSLSFLVSKQNSPIPSPSSFSPSQFKLILAKSFFLAKIFVIRFQSLRFCGTGAMILGEFSGNITAKFLLEEQNPNRNFNSLKVRGFRLLFATLFFLSMCWDRAACFPFTRSFIEEFGFSVYPRDSCLRIWPMLLPFLSGFLGCFEKVSMNWGSIRHQGRKQVRIFSLFLATMLLFIPAVVSFFVFRGGGHGVSVESFGWPLANVVVFGVILSETHGDDKICNSKDFKKEFFVTLACIIALELFYSSEVSLAGLLFCGLLLYFAVCELDPLYSQYLDLGLESSDSLSMSIMKPIHHILREKKSRKIALFLLINTCYMVVEFVAGFMSNSLGLISDACHMLFDCAALAIGLYASYISCLPANTQFNYGRGRFEILSGYANAVFLVLVGSLIVLESLERLFDPQEIAINSLLTVSVGGLLVNVVGLIFFHEEHHHAHGGSCSHSDTHSHHHHAHSGLCSHSDTRSHSHSSSQVCAHHHHHNHDHHHQNDGKESGKRQYQHQHRHIDHNMEGIFLHVLADTLGSVGVIISTLLIKFKGWLVADPACSIFISVLIVSSVIPLLRNSAEILLQRVPRVHEQSIRRAILDIQGMKGISGIQTLHVWSFTNADVIGTLHLHVSEEAFMASVKTQVSHILLDAGIKDLTMQVEYVKQQ